MSVSPSAPASIYDDYDYSRYEEDYCRQPKPIIDFVYKMVGREPKDILSIGCGTGYIEESLVAAGHRVVGFDLSAEACDLSRARGIDASTTNVLELDADAYPHRFDYIIGIDIWEHIPESRLLLKKVAALLKKDGLFLLKAPNFGHFKFRGMYLLKGSLGTERQLHLGHYAHYNYAESIRVVNSSAMEVIEKWCYTPIPWPMLFRYNPLLAPNLMSLSTMMVLKARR